MASDSDIAIVGIGCRFPGADNKDEFWRVLVNGENHVNEIPPERWNNDVFYSEDKDAPGKIYVRKAGLIKDYDKFDPRPFGISDAEAEQMDPQQRFVLECVHMAFEDGGITRKSVNGSRTGVYIGVMNDDYKSLFTGQHIHDTPYSATGFSSTIIAARVSYVFNLQGPCLALDTACSSGLISVHLGSQALLSGDCEMAICGGVSCIVSPETFIPLCRARMMSAVGQCQTFCDTADGYARGEGCGIVILKKLSQAVKDGNKIWGIIKTGSNHDGRTAQPITSPSGEQQYKLFDTLYKTSGIDPSRIQYIEMHGDIPET